MSEIENSSIVSCWNTVGVWGSQAPRCEKLQEVTHCRNCRVYWDAGRQVFDKAIPEGYLEQWTEVLAGAVEPQSSLSQSIIYFRLGNEWFSLSTKNFVEVSQVKLIHNIPHQTSNLILGVVNIGGTVRLCFSLSYLLGIDDKDDKSKDDGHGIYRRYIVVKVDGTDFVFPVDEVGGVYRYDPKDLLQIPATIEPEKADLLLGVLEVKGNKVACIDADRLAQAFEGVVGE